MQHTYKIMGMHCQACVMRLHQALADLEGVRKASVTLNPPQAQLVVSTDVSEESVMRAVAGAGDYVAKRATEPLRESAVSPSISADRDAGSAVGGRTSTYYPLFLIVGFLLLGSALLQARATTWRWGSLMTDFMGGFFVVFAFFKLLDLRGFATAFQSYDIIAAKSRAYGIFYPFLELALGIAYLVRFAPFWTNMVTLAVMLVGSIGVIRSLWTRQKIQCACLGTVFELPMSTVTLVEDLGMAAMAIAMITFGG